MDNPKNDRYYLDRLLNDLSTIERHMATRQKNALQPTKCCRMR